MGRRGGRGDGGGRGGHGRRDERPGGARDDSDVLDRRPDDRGARDYRPGRSPRRSLSPDHRPRRGARSPSPNRRARRSPSSDHHRARPRPRDGGGERDLPLRGQGDYGRVPYRYDHPGRGDRSPRGSNDGRGPNGSYDGRGLNGSYDGRGASGSYDSRGASGRYDAPPAYMLPEHPPHLGRATKKESEFLGGPDGRSIHTESEFYGGAGMTLRVSSTGLGRTSSLYLDRRSPPPLPPPPPMSPPPRAIYPSETGFLTGVSTMKGEDSFGAGSTRGFQYRDLPGVPYVGSRELERLDPGRDLPIDRDGEMDRLYSSRGTFDSDIATTMQLKRYAGSSSSVLAKDRPYRVHGEGYEPIKGYAMDGLCRSSHDSLRRESSHARRFSESSLERNSGHDDKILLGITRQTHSKHPPNASVEYDADGYGRRGPENDTYLALRNLYGNDSRDSRASTRHTLGSSPLTGLKDERSNHQVRISRRMALAEDEDGMEYNVQNSYHGNTPARYHTTKDAHIRYSGSPDPLELARHPVHQHEFASYEDGCELSDQEVSPMAYRRGSQRAAYSGHDMDIYQADGPPGREYYNDEIDAFDLSPERMSRSYDLVDGEDGYDTRYDMPTSRNVFSRIALPSNINGEWIDADQGNHPHPNTSAYGCSKYKPISERLSRPMLQPQFGESAMPGRGRGGLTKSAKKRLRAGLPQLHGGYTSERNEFVRPNKKLKLSEDNHKGAASNNEDAPDEDLSVQKDPPEGSEEFSKQVHQAFLKFSKILNESATMQRRYHEAPKGSLSCCVCGSVTRKFPDIDALMSHAYNTCKPGLKAKHLGFHKALCVLMGWNWHVAPDTSKAYQSVPAEEVNAMKRDLMLWPPVVVIHNSSISNKAKVAEAKIVSIKEIEGVLADIGVACDKAKVTHGRPANQSVFLVKFPPKISGFEEAMRIHKHFTTVNHGKEEFQAIEGDEGKKAAPANKLEELLYAHIAVAEDLGYLDDETKKRCVVRSKNGIEAKADATLNLDSEGAK